MPPKASLMLRSARRAHLEARTALQPPRDIGWSSGFWAAFAVCGAFLVIAVPLLNLWAPAGSAAALPDYLIPLLGKYLCYALLALSLDLVWGYAGILSLGHGAFFALGGY
jgi:ABC-type branched-subunit amino acid transport system permease subunit